MSAALIHFPRVPQIAQFATAIMNQDISRANIMMYPTVLM
jgi:hypothetical protein